ncbi:SDR family NAD(P)-dependent oxidoreductase [Bacillus sp. FJAT-45037]|uniref:SDR family NAD(P)-dependent oxidoreductase n=1 Tax=Bacillus sp. FJAT-45037 TaxID=2011007 RepID=UPI000C249169|nr:SDR family oxidoreductase [Bacillus sp. FJAT-45037]
MRTVIITGATSGIGKSTVHRFAKEGDHVIAVGRNQQKGTQLIKEIDSLGYRGNVDFFQANVASEQEVEALYKELAMTFSRIDSLVNNAGIARPGVGNIQRIEEMEWDDVFQTNVKAAFFMMKHGLRSMNYKTGASIINIAAAAGVTNFPPALAAYSASKAALVSLTKTMAVRYAKQKIRINSISPGPVDTPLAHWLYGGEEAFLKASSKHPRGSSASPEEIAGIVYFLASKDASYVTGHNLIADGGYSLK